MKRYDRLSQLEIKKPCSADWDAMTGDEAKRYCGHCRKHVHNLSEMAADEAEAVLNSGPVCVRYRSDGAGRIITKTALIASAALMMAGCATGDKPSTVVGEMESPPTVPVSNPRHAMGSAAPTLPPKVEPEIMGEIAPPEPELTMGMVAPITSMGKPVSPPDERGDTTFRKSTD